jgi:hypothetical protein
MLVKTALPVPGGLAGLVKCNEISNLIERLACEVVFENGVTGVTASPPAPNKAIKGKTGHFEFSEHSNYALDTGVSLVENAFAAPGAEGCGGIFSFLLDPILNAKEGLPAAAGNNTAILNDPVQIASSEAVKASEG